MIVLDTNIVIDIFVFNDAASAPLKQALINGQLRWLATAAMREELARVLGYPKIVVQLARFQLDAAQVLAQFDQYSQTVEAPLALAAQAPQVSQTSIICTDPDDQKFIDLALAHRATLVSKDQALLALAKPLALRGVVVASSWS